MSSEVTPSSYLFHRVWIDETVEVAAPLSEVQAALEDVRTWADWTPGMRKLRISAEEPVHRGSSFWMLLKMHPLPPLWVPAVVYVLQRGHIEWGGGGLRSVIRHRFELTETKSGGTAVRHAEYATNLLAIVLLPFEKAFRAHDRRWSATIAERFAADG